MKVLSILGIIISSIGLLCVFFAADTATVIAGLIIYGYFLGFSIVALKHK